jgi:hypothetical protein
MQSCYNTLSEKYICALSLVLVFFSSQAHSKDIEIKAQLLVDQSVIAQQVDQVIAENNRISSSLIELKYEDELPVFIDEIRFDLSFGPSQSGYLNESQILVTKMPEIRVSGLIPRVHIVGSINKIINGVQFNIKVDSECKNINYEATFTENVINTKFNTTSSESQFTFGTTKSNIAPFSCSAVQGMDAFLTQRVGQVLENKVMLQQMLSSQLDRILKQQAVRVNESSLVAVNQFLKKIDPDLHVSHTQLNFSKDQSVMDLILKTRSFVEYKATNTVFKSSMHVKTNAAVFVSKQDFDFLIQNAMAKKLSELEYSSDDIPEFKKLLNSRFKQFFIWPALMKRPKGLPLKLKPILENFSTEIPTEQFQKNLNFKMQIGQWVLDLTEPMVYLRSRAIFRADVLNTVQLQELKNSYVWDQNYLSAHHVSQRISLGLVNSAAQGLIQGKINSFIPTSTQSFLKNVKYLYLSKDQILELGLEQGR